MESRQVTSRLSDPIMKVGIFARLALGVGLVLLLPLIAMQFTAEVNWNAADFIVMGFLAFTAGSLFILAWRNLPRRSRVVACLLISAAFLYVWAELAVGVFTGLGS